MLAVEWSGRGDYSDLDRPGLVLRCGERGQYTGLLGGSGMVERFLRLFRGKLRSMTFNAVNGVMPMHSEII